MSDGDAARPALGGNDGSSHSRAPSLDGVPMKQNRRKKLLEHIQRMSSTSSLARIGGRGSSSSYRNGAKASLSCASIVSSPSALYGRSLRDSDDARISGYSTAPTSTAGTPRSNTPLSDPVARIRLLRHSSAHGTASLPADLRSRVNGVSSPLAYEQQIDYFTQQIKKPKKKSVEFWKDVPNEIKIHIFQYLEPKELVRCSSVSKCWYQMCFDGQLWKAVDCASFYTDITPTSLARILINASPFIQSLNVRGCVQMKDYWMKDGHFLVSDIRNLVSFSAEGSKMNKLAVHCFLLRNPKLKFVNLCGLDACTSSTMKTISASCTQLQFLDVSWCPNIDCRGLLHVVQHCPGLEDLRASEVKGFQDDSLMQALFKYNTLKRLVLNNCESLTDTSITVLVQGKNPSFDPLTTFPAVPPRKLRHLDVSYCPALTDKGIKALVNNVPYLSGLQLSFNHRITDASLAALLPSLPQLTHLDLEELTLLSNSTLQVLATSPCAARLKHLNISFCENLGDTGMLPLLRAASQIRTLYLDNTRVSDLVLAESAIQLARRNRGRRHSGVPRVGLRIVVFDCGNITWAGVREVLARNAETHHPFTNVHDSPPSSYPAEIISLHCFFGWMQTVEEHTKRVLRGDFLAASKLDRKWAAYMMANEEAGIGGGGLVGRRRRRMREAELLHAEEEEGTEGSQRRRRARSGGCMVM